MIALVMYYIVVIRVSLFQKVHCSKFQKPKFTGSGVIPYHISLCSSTCKATSSVSFFCWM